MTAQEIFDQVVRHLLTQRRRATGSGDRNGLCSYRTPEGLRCAVGCLIPDDVYTPDMEDKGIDDLIEDWEELSWMREHEKLLSKLQYVHDNEDVDDWEKELAQVALDNELSMP